MTDKLNEGDVMNIEVINEAVKKAKDFGIKPLDLNGKKYYFWIYDDERGWVASDDPRARDTLVKQMGGDWLPEAPGSSISPKA